MKYRILLAGWLFGILMSVGTGDSPGAEDSTARTMMDFYRQASEAKADGRLDRARDLFRQGRDLVPDSPHFLLETAILDAALEDTAGCLRNLKRLAELGGVVDLEEIEEIAPLLESPGFQRVVLRFATNPGPFTPPPAVAVLEGNDLWPEGVAYDPETDRIFSGSVTQRKIVQVQDGVQTDFGTTADDDLLEVIGLWVDPMRRHLWAATGADSTATDFTGASFGDAPRTNEIVQYHLDQGHLLARYPQAPDGRIHMWNDITVASDGTAYFTDMNTSEIYRIPPGGHPELYLALVRFSHPNGIVASDDRELLYVGCLETVAIVDIETRQVDEFLRKPNQCLGLVDGMALSGRLLFLVQNSGLLGMRWSRVEMDETGRKVEAMKIVPCSWPDGLMPYTCAVGDGVVLVNGTPPFSEFGKADLANPAIFAFPFE